MSVQLRPIQEKAIQEILQAIQDGKTDIVVQAPTGVGKSLIALEVAKALEERQMRSFILTSEKLLQQQYEDDCKGKFAPRHSTAVSISGIDNYNCTINGKKFSLGHCKSLGLSNRKALNLACAGGCEYLQRWLSAQAAGTAIFNYSYYLIQMNYVLKKMNEHAPFQRREVVICDEAHSLPNIIESHFACYVDRDIVTRIKEVQDGLREDGAIIEFLGVKWGDLGKAISALFKVPYRESAEQLSHLKGIYRMGVEINRRIADSKNTIRYKYNINAGEDASSDDFVSAAIAANEKLPPSVKRFLSFSDSFKDYMCKLEDYIKIIDEQGLENMVVEGRPNGRTYRNLCDEKLFENHFRPFSDVRIYLSATLQPENMLKRWNLSPETTHVMNLTSGWDPKRSPVVLKNIANFKHSNISAAIDKAVAEIDSILQQHPEQRGVIHTTSYEILQKLKERCTQTHRLVPYAGTAEKMEMIRGLERMPKNAVIIGPSLTQGVDLKDELAEFNIIVKMSYPNIASALWKKRFQKKRFIYWAEAANVLEQAAGRSTRHSEDSSVTYVLDERAHKFIKSPSTRKYFSKEFISRVEC